VNTGLSRLVSRSRYETRLLQDVVFFSQQLSEMVLRLFKVLLLVGATGFWPAGQAGYTYTE
jgi:hypothetical protein